MRPLSRIAPFQVFVPKFLWGTPARSRVSDQCGYWNTLINLLDWKSDGLAKWRIKIRNAFHRNASDHEQVHNFQPAEGGDLWYKTKISWYWLTGSLSRPTSGGFAGSATVLYRHWHAICNVTARILQQPQQQHPKKIHPPQEAVIPDRHALNLRKTT